MSHTMTSVNGLAGLGDFREAVAGMVAGGDLDRLIRAIFGIQDQLVNAINTRAQIVNEHRKAVDFYNEAFSNKDLSFVTAVQAYEAAKMGVEIFARQVQTLNELDVVFTRISEALSSAGLSGDANAVNQTVTQIRRFTSDTDKVMSGIAEYSSAKFAIIAEFNRELAAAGISTSDYSNPGWFSAYVRGSARVVPFENEPSPPSGLSGLGGLDGLPMLAVAIIWVIGIVAAAVVAIVTINKIIAALNSQAETQRALILERNRQKETLRQQLYAEGRAQAEIDAIMVGYDKETVRQTDDVPKSGFGKELLLPIGIGVLALIGLKAAKVL